MYSTPEEIRSAVDAYGTHIKEHNRRILESPLSPRYNSEEAGLENDGDSTYNRTRLGSLRSVCGDELERVASTPIEVLDHCDELAGLCDLDGCNGPRPPDTKEEVARQERPSADLERRLREQCLPEVHDNITASEELRVLARHARGLSGPGLGGGLKSVYQAMFWSGLPTSPADIRGPRELDNVMSCQWESAAGWEEPSGYEGYFYMVYCRVKTEDGEEAGPWWWRYAAMNPLDCCVFDTIPELLEWYAVYREGSIPDAMT
ncbi:hypothetical protein C8035_v009092 [Colletotrichum spinosum]|uniref:Uncharacterized protein n=1 Tax=Colletotrichum spinosum TaxID=1347390 RepID=A0A4R8PVD4_9PEZI|nr:hypothetical protein C8035_v009092 [Colletotrichum spinosum]